ncbi:uncharacterized protein LOC122808336 [Protopterus annectens]|uniref:uncharacterized protein LOC122808336 n=1 Tax=Protopterus annectens TaxID=7888 RepID=UPI001CFAC2FE|nr:uncharacterized protein LOC122808336 [Protopterus annectens]
MPLCIMWNTAMLLSIILPVLGRKPVQFPSFVQVHLGQSVIITCSIPGFSSYCPDMLWYVQHLAGDIQLLVVNERFSSVQDSASRNCTLTIKNITRNDAGMYWCFGCSTVLRHFGNGTKLIIADDTAYTPQVFVVPPAAEEMKNRNKTTLICLVFNIPLEQIMIYWNISGNITNGMTDKKLITSDEGYYVTNILMIKSDMWSKWATYSCVVKVGNETFTSNSIQRDALIPYRSSGLFAEASVSSCLGVSVFLVVALVIILIYYRKRLSEERMYRRRHPLFLAVENYVILDGLRLQHNALLSRSQQNHEQSAALWTDLVSAVNQPGLQERSYEQVRHWSTNMINAV